MVRILFLFILIFYVSTVWAKSIVFGFYPYDSPSKIYQDFQPFKEYLEKKTGVEIKIYFAYKYLNLIKDFGENKVDIAILGPAPYVKVKDKYGNVEILAKEVLENDEIDKVVFISNVNSHIYTFNDLKGKSFAFGDFQSCGTHFYPRYILQKNNIRLSDFKFYDFLTSHSRVIQAVSYGDFDAGATRLNIYNQYKNEKTKIFAGPFKIAPHVIVARSGLDESLKKKIKSALFEIKDKRILNAFQEKLTGFAEAYDYEFAEIRKIIQIIEGN